GAHPPMAMVMPDASRATTSSSVISLSAMSAGRVGVAALDEGVPGLVGPPRQVGLEGAALLEAVAALHVPQVDAVERLLSCPDDRGRLGGDLDRHLAGRGHQLGP